MSLEIGLAKERTYSLEDFVERRGGGVQKVQTVQLNSRISRPLYPVLYI